jgi:hypothetical protein
MPSTRTTSGGARVILADEEEEQDAGTTIGLDWDQRDGHDLIVVGHGRIAKPKHSWLVAPEAVLSPADVDSLAAAVRDPQRCCANSPERINVATAAASSFDRYLYEPDPAVSLEIDDEHAYALVEALLIGERAATEDYRAWLRPAAQPHGCHIASVRFIDDSSRDENQLLQELHAFPLPPDERKKILAAYHVRPRYIDVRVESDGPMTVGTLLDAGRDVHALLHALRGGPLEATSAANLLRARRPHLLIDLAESEWFEAKRKPYQLDAPETRAATAAKIELAQDVARFANGHRAALLVIGLGTTRRDGSDVVDSVTPVTLRSLSPQRYRDVLDERIYPAVEGLTIEQVDLGVGRGC